MLNKKVKKRPALNRLKFKTKIFYIYPQSSRSEFFNKLIASDFANIMNNATIINIFNSDICIIAHINT